MKKRKDMKEMMTKQRTSVKYIDPINRFIRKLESSMNPFFFEVTMLFLSEISNNLSCSN